MTLNTKRLFFSFIIIVNICSIRTETSSEAELRPPFTYWPSLEKFVRSTLDKTVTRNIGKLYDIFKTLNASSACKTSLQDLAWGLRNIEGWAFEMVDASGKPPSGILGGTAIDFGSFDGCLKIRVGETSGEREAFKGRYCMLGYKSPLMMPLYKKTHDGREYVEAHGTPPEWIAEVLNKTGAYLLRSAFWFGTCIPSTCTEEDIQQVVTSLIKPLGFGVKVAGCYVDEPKEWSTSALVAVYILGFLLGMSVIGTIFDVVCRNFFDEVPSTTQNYCGLKALRAFSVYTNTEKLFDIPSGTDVLGCFNGIRFFSACWIVLGHTYWFTDTWKYLKYRNALSLIDQFNYYLPAAVLENFTIPVGSFFFMSGFLLVYSTWRQLVKTGGRLNIFMFLVHKYWRMTPALGLMIVMFLALPVIGSGPLWKSTLDPPITACETRWWTNMLYINNMWDSEDYCLVHTWYLPALMQFHIIGAILLLLIYRWPVVGVSAGIAIAAGSCIATALITVWNDFPMPTPAVSKDLDLMDSYNSKIYTKPFCHVPSYFIGMVVAYLVLKYKDIKLNWKIQVLGWTLAITCALSSVYGLYGPADHVEVRAFYISCYRIGWGLSVGWLAYVCITGQGGIANRILSWKAFTPLGQLSYLVYLLHPLIMLYRTASLKERIHYGHNELVFEFLTCTLIAFFLSYMGHVAVEKPILVLEGIILRPKVVTGEKLCEKKNSISKEPPVLINGFKSLDP